MASEYNARVLKLDLPEQDALKNDSERCSADPRLLESIGRAVGHQVRITRADAPGFLALYTVVQPNPAADLGDPNRANVVRTGLQGRERLGTSAEMDAVVRAAVVDAPPPASGVRFFELGEHDPSQRYFIAIAPHGGDIEENTDEEAEFLRTALASSGYPASTWMCKGFGDQQQGASDRFHITSGDLNPKCFPLLGRIAARRFCYGVAFHGFARKAEDFDVYIGGGAPPPLKRLIATALERASLPVRIKIADDRDDPKFQGISPENIINRLAAQGIHIEQSVEARKFAEQIARAVATVYRSPVRRLLCALTNVFG
jgi:phage replication-related protein YjqB (UPF0714/DUF867 family)